VKYKVTGVVQMYGCTGVLQRYRSFTVVQDDTGLQGFRNCTDV